MTEEFVDVDFQAMALRVIAKMKDNDYSFETAMSAQFREEGRHLPNSASLQRFWEACWKEVQQAIADDPKIAADLLPF
jgi:hypothetical protein